MEIFKSNIVKMLLASGYQNVVFQEDMGNLYKNKIYLRRDNHLVNIIDGEVLTKDELKKVFDENYNLLKEIKADYYFVSIQLILFDGAIGNDKREVIKKMYEEIPSERKFLVTSSLDISKTKIKYYFDKGNIKESFYKTLKVILKHDVKNLKDEDIQRFIEDKTLKILNIRPYVTYIILIINFILGLALFIQTTYYLTKGNGHLTFGWNFNENFLDMYGAKFNASMNQHEYYRWITPIFLHASVAHLLSNSIGIFIFGRLVEQTFGRLKMTTIYLLSGMAGVLGSYIIYPRITSVGASGAIFGLLGALYYLGKKYKYSLDKSFTAGIAILIVINLVMGFTMENIDNAGHIGGLIGGILFANIVGVYRGSTKGKVVETSENSKLIE